MIKIKLRNVVLIDLYYTIFFCIASFVSEFKIQLVIIFLSLFMARTITNYYISESKGRG